MLSPDGFRQKVVRDRFERIADTYDDTIVVRRTAYNDRVDGYIAARLADGNELRLLDAACGTGARWEHLRTLLPATSAWGLDASSAMCRRARQRGGFLEVRQAELEHIPYADGSFDVVTCLFFSFCYLTSRAARLRALAEMRRVLTPGGLLALDVINLRHRGEGLAYRRSRAALAADRVRSWLDPRLADGDKLYRTPLGDSTLRGYFHGFTHHSFDRLLRRADLRGELLTVGYNSGLVRPDHRQGQILALLRR